MKFLQAFQSRRRNSIPRYRHTPRAADTDRLDLATLDGPNEEKKKKKRVDGTLRQGELQVSIESFVRKKKRRRRGGKNA
jgi:hypothetical protein